MPFKSILFPVFILFGVNYCFCQDNPEKKNRLTPDVIERYHVRADSPTIKDGVYQAFYNRKQLIAYGNYKNGKRIGEWQFYNGRGAILETYDFDRDTIVYEAFENRRSNLRYYVDKKLTDSDKTTKPYRLGGRYYGYLPYLASFKAPFVPEFGTESLYSVNAELLISPLGRLADYKVSIVGPDFSQTITLSTTIFSEEDKKFIPARINGEPVICRILIKCRLTADGNIDFY